MRARRWSLSTRPPRDVTNSGSAAGRSRSSSASTPADTGTSWPRPDRPPCPQAPERHVHITNAQGARLTQPQAGRAQQHHQTLVLGTVPRQHPRLRDRQEHGLPPLLPAYPHRRQIHHPTPQRPRQVLQHLVPQRRRRRAPRVDRPDNDTCASDASTSPTTVHRHRPCTYAASKRAASAPFMDWCRLPASHTSTHSPTVERSVGLSAPDATRVAFSRSISARVRHDVTGQPRTRTRYRRPRPSRLD